MEIIALLLLFVIGLFDIVGRYFLIERIVEAKVTDESQRNTIKFVVFFTTLLLSFFIPTLLTK